MTERIDATNATEHMADAESTAESAKAAVRGVEETHPEYVDFAVDDFPGGLPACLEAILMVADQPQTATELARILALDRNTVEEALRALHDDYEGDESRDIRPRGFELRRTARGWQFASRAAFEPVVSSFVTDGQTARLSQAALEALAIVAYRQPVTRAQVAAIRGVNSRAALLVTSEFFLDQMGLKSLDELPSLAPFLPSVAEMTQSKSEDTDVIS